jgi:DNA mismatch endonuclease (patch repair protein)
MEQGAEVADRVTVAVRSRMMSSVRSSNTAAERQVRSALHRAGLRFRINCPDLPGRPDIVLLRHRAVVFVHGCFWHQHPGCPKSTRPRSNANSWNRKLDANVERDIRTSRVLVCSGWRVFVVWECEIAERRLDRLVKSVKLNNIAESETAGERLLPSVDRMSHMT